MVGFKKKECFENSFLFNLETIITFCEKKAEKVILFHASLHPKSYFWHKKKEKIMQKNNNNK